MSSHKQGVRSRNGTKIDLYKSSPNPPIAVTFLKQELQIQKAIPNCTSALSGGVLAHRELKMTSFQNQRKQKLQATPSCYRYKAGATSTWNSIFLCSPNLILILWIAIILTY
uniref:Uncharacterized protein n=1 Tax=Micrurus spixii TaxID=129469 RepID=A0A2D4M0R0_9SAUR